MVDIYPYSLLAADPTSSYYVYWIDDRDDADGAEQDFNYGDDPDDLDRTASSTGESIESHSAYLYGVYLSELEEDTVYYGNIACEEDVEFHTLPAQLPSDGLNIGVYSDIHIDRNDGIGDPEDMAPIRDEEFDLILFVGDYITWGDDTTDDKTTDEVTDWWVDLFGEWYGVLNADRLHPVFPTVGNHEVGNHSWNGTGDVDPTAGFFQFFYDIPANLDPAGENYGRIMVGDYLQLVALDSHSAHASDVGNWLEEAVSDDETIRCTIPFHHSPFLTSGIRQDPDEGLQERLRDEWARTLWELESFVCHFSGHLHVREYSVPWTIVDTEPADTNYIELDGGDDGYLVERDGDGNRIREFGTGYRSNRDNDQQWYTDLVENQNQFYSLSLTHSELVVRELDANGNEYQTHSFDLREPAVRKRIFIDGSWT